MQWCPESIMYFSVTEIHLYFPLQTRTHNLASCYMILYWTNVSDLKGLPQRHYYIGCSENTLCMIHHDLSEMRSKTFIAPPTTESSGSTDKRCRCCKAWDLSSILKLVGAVGEDSHLCIEAEQNVLNLSMDFIVQCTSFSIESANIAEKQVSVKTEIKLAEKHASRMHGILYLEYRVLGAQGNTE